MSAEGTVRDGAGAGFELIETMRWEPQVGFVRLERHLARLYRSAHEFGFGYDPAKIGELLSDAVREPDRLLRARLALSRDGSVKVTTQSYEPLPAHETWTLRIAGSRLDSADPLLRHKTTRRDIYAAARSEYQLHQADEVILLNERHEVCEGTMTNIFVDIGDEVLLTPPLSCGLLPGVLRAEFLDTGRAREAVLGPGDLMDANALFVGNSLRGPIRAKLDV